MAETLVSFELSKLAKEAGFTEEVLHAYIIETESLEDYTIEGGYYNYNIENSKCISAPTLSLLQKWFREVHNIHVEVYNEFDKYITLIHTTIYMDEVRHRKEDWSSKGPHNTYEEALEKGLFEAFKLIKK